MKTKAQNRTKLIQAILAFSLLIPGFSQAQQDVEFSGGIPLAPTGLADIPLGEGPFEYQTAEGMDIRVVVVARAIEYPTSIVFLPDDKMLVSTRTGDLRLIENDALDPEPVQGGPTSFFRGLSGAPASVHGYNDLVLHPNFDQNHYIYLSYTQPRGGDSLGSAIGRGIWNGESITDFTDIWLADTGVSGVIRLAFDDNNMLFFNTSGGLPQDLSSHGGKIMRIHDDGRLPSDNPLVNQTNTKPEIYSFGHRSALGLAIHPGSGELWQSENGPNGGDEINIIKPGLNYGWPLVSLGRTYQGPWQAEIPTHEGYESPVAYWMPAIAVSGMTFYTGDALPKWKGDLFVGALRTGEIPGTGHIERILFNQNMEELRRESLLTDLRQRVRDVRQGLDGMIYVLTDEIDGAVLRIEPNE